MNHHDSASMAKVTIRVTNITQHKAATFFQQWQHRQGIIFLQVDVKKEKIVVHYNALEVSLGEIISALAVVDVLLKTGWIFEWRLHLARQIEQNIRDNLNHIPHCCGKAPNKAQVKK